MSESPEETPADRARALLVQMAETSVMPARSSERGANVYREWRKAAEAIEEVLAYHDGYEVELETLVRLVGALLAAFSASSNGSATWRTEVPQGKAPQFRRAINALMRHIRERAHE